MATTPEAIPHPARKRNHPPKPSRIELAREFDAVPMDGLVTSAQSAAFLNVSEAKLERDRWAGMGVPYLKMGRHVRYRKRDILASLENKVRTSTTIAAGREG